MHAVILWQAAYRVSLSQSTVIAAVHCDGCGVRRRQPALAQGSAIYLALYSCLNLSLSLSCYGVAIDIAWRKVY